MATMTASALNNFADLALSLPMPTLEATIKQNPAVIDSTGYDGRTALQKAVMVGNLPVVRLLLQYNADPNFRNQAGDTAVHVACCRGLLNVFVTLLKHGGDPMVQDGLGRLAIHCATLSGSLILVQYLAEVCEVNLDAEDNRGCTPLHTSAACGHLNLVEYLVHTKKVDRTHVDREGNSALHCAAQGGVSGVGWAVVYPGAEQLLTQHNHAGHTPLQVAQNTSNISPDCRRWYEKWTRQYKRSGALESPRLIWLLHLLTPAAIFHIGLVASVLIMPHHQWTLGLPVFIVTLAVMARQHHRLKHPVRWANPIYLGAYSAGLLTTLGCYALVLDPQTPLLSLLVWSFVCFHLILFYKLVTGDPGIVQPEGPLQEVLRGVGEGVVKGYCSECQLASPPLSHHCRLCCSCHHSTDHHCLFLNTCVAAYNHRRFVVFIFTNIVLMVAFLYGALGTSFPIAATAVAVGSVKIQPVQDHTHQQKIDSVDGKGVSMMGSDAVWVDRLLSTLMHLMNENMWVFLMLVCNVASLAWAVNLLSYQYKVIGSQQTTLCRLKLGNPVGKVTRRERLRNFWTFLLRGRVPLTNQMHYFNQV